MRWLERRQLLALLAANLGGCALREGAPLSVTLPPSPAAEADASQIALGIIHDRNTLYGARGWALFHVDAAHGTRLAQASRAVFGVGYLLDAMELDLAEGFARVFTASTGMTNFGHSCEAVHVFEHRLSPERVAEAFEAAVENRRAERFVTSDGHPCAHLRLGSVPRLLALPTPNLIVTLPESAEADVGRFVAGARLPLARAREAVELVCLRPDSEVVGVDIPPTVLDARVTVWLSAAGAKVDFAALSTDERSAGSDAGWLTQRIDEALTLDLAIAQLKVLGPYLFTADGRTVRSHMRFSRDETEWIVAMARNLQPGG
jgi:hypothetical protein